MLTCEEFDQLDVGDRVETVPMLKVLSTEPVVLVTDAKGQDQRGNEYISFTATYFGINLGPWTCTKQGAKLLWRTS